MDQRARGAEYCCLLSLQSNFAEKAVLTNEMGNKKERGWDKKKEEGCRNRLKGKIKQIGYYVSSELSVSSNPMQWCWSVVEFCAERSDGRKEGILFLSNGFTKSRGWCVSYSTLRSREPFQTANSCLLQKVETRRGVGLEKSEKEDGAYLLGVKRERKLLKIRSTLWWGIHVSRMRDEKDESAIRSLSAHLMLCVCAVCVVLCILGDGGSVWWEWMKEKENPKEDGSFQDFRAKERVIETACFIHFSTAFMPSYSLSSPGLRIRLHIIVREE